MVCYVQRQKSNAEKKNMEVDGCKSRAGQRKVKKRTLINKEWDMTVNRGKLKKNTCCTYRVFVWRQNDNEVLENMNIGNVSEIDGKTSVFDQWTYSETPHL